MTITVNMSKEEFLEYCSYAKFKSDVKCGIIDIEGYLNDFMKCLLEDGIWKDNNKYDKTYTKLLKSINNMKGGNFE